VLLLLLALAVSAGCGSAAAQGSSGSDRPRAQPSAVGSVASSRPAVDPVRRGPPEGNIEQGAAARIRRADLMKTLSAGLGIFLQRVQVEPLLVLGRFRGWRIASLQGAGPAWGGLKPGDVVLRVNGKPIERPEQALECWQSLAFARELRVAYMRDGAPSELVLPIEDRPESRRRAGP
jgi:hypothetical protein